MFCRIHSGAIHGIDGILIEVEVDISEGLPNLSMVGMLSAEVKESAERVRTALKNSDIRIPPKRITVNLSPADIRKQGSYYDLPITAGILAAMGYVEPEALRQSLVLGELSLDGTVNPVNGVLPIVYAAREAGLTSCFVPRENAKEGAVMEGIQVIGVHTLRQLLHHLKGDGRIAPAQVDRQALLESGKQQSEVDFSEVSGQEPIKRAVQVAAAGMHNLLMIGPPGAGKTMIARRIPTILPPLEFSECIEISKIYSVAGCLKDNRAFITNRPFRAPHHTISASSLVGGGKLPKPGEISLSNYGVLFLDELPEFQKSVLEVLRQPMEDRKILVSRVHGRYEFPTKFMLVAAMNPCSCGYYPDRNRCNCSETEVTKYLGRISRPLLDRMDICMEVPQVEYHQMIHGLQERAKSSGAFTERESSAVMRDRVCKAREIQSHRYKNEHIYTNSELSSSQIKQYCQLDAQGEQLLEQAFQQLQLSARGYNRILKVSRTIADLEGSSNITSLHLSEAICYRTTDSLFWKH